MNIDLLKRLGLFAALILTQALVLNHIHLFTYATPLIYVYFVVSFRRGYPKWGILLWSFCIGVCADAFSNTPGVAAASTTILGLVQPYMLELFIQRDNDEDIKPSLQSMRWGAYLPYCSLMVIIYCILFYTFETFSFFNPLQWGISIASSTVLTLLLILVIDNMRKKNV